MAEKNGPHRVIPPGTPLPPTRRGILEKWPEVKEVMATPREPLPDLTESSYPEVNAEEPRFVLLGSDFFASVVYMVAVGLLLFFMPLLHGLLGGWLGGWRARRLGRALLAAAVASVVVPGVFWVGYFAFGPPAKTRIFYGLGFGYWTALYVACLVLGTLAGVASRSVPRRAVA
jgi:hypothetical protein